MFVIYKNGWVLYKPCKSVTYKACKFIKYKVCKNLWVLVRPCEWLWNLTFETMSEPSGKPSKLKALINFVGWSKGVGLEQPCQMFLRVPTTPLTPAHPGCVVTNLLTLVFPYLQSSYFTNLQSSQFTSSRSVFLQTCKVCILQACKVCTLQTCKVWSLQCWAQGP